MAHVGPVVNDAVANPVPEATEQVLEVKPTCALSTLHAPAAFVVMELVRIGAF
jgi:hypothetical protein